VTMLTRGDTLIKSVCTADLLSLGKTGLARWYRRRAERPHIIRSRSASTAIRWHVSIGAQRIAAVVARVVGTVVATAVGSAVLSARVSIAVVNLM
jgi:hypothetical protein